MKMFAVLAVVPVFLIASPATSSAGWISWGSAGADPLPNTTLVESGYEGAVFTVDFAGLDAATVMTEEGAFTLISSPRCGVTTDIGTPSLPVLREHLEIPQAAVPVLEIVKTRYEEVSLADLGIEGRIFPTQHPVPKIPGAREAMAFELDESSYEVDSFLPVAAARIADSGQVRAHRFVQVEIFPVQYNPKAGAIRYLTHIEIRITFKGGDRDETERRLARFASPGFDTFASREFLNNETFTSGGKDILDTPPGYLIITHDDFADEMGTFTILKQTMGYRVTMTKLSDIPMSSAQSIADYIQEAYETWSVPPAFVLLVGDTAQIPCFIESSGGDNIATDLPFATMDGTSDWHPDLYVGRFSCNNEAEVATLASKTVEYTMFSMSSGTDWIKNATFMASTDNSNISEGTHNYVINSWLDPDGFTCSKRYTDTYGATSSQVISDINAGLSQITFSGHGSPDGWYDGPQIESSDLWPLSNVEMYPVVQSYACLTGAFLEDCFAEAWTTHTNGGVLFFGSSINSLWDEDDILERGVYDAWFGGEYTLIRGALNEGLWDVYDYYSGGGQTYEYFHQYNVFGDPSLDPWTKAPAELFVEHEQLLPLGTETFEVSVTDVLDDPLEDALVCIWDLDQIHQTGYTDTAGQIAFTLSPGPEENTSMKVTVSRHNFIPYFGSFSFSDVDTDSDTDTDSDSDADSDTDTDTDTNPAAVPFHHPSNSGCGCSQTKGSSTTSFIMLSLGVFLG